MRNPPTLAEMRHSLAEDTPTSIEGEIRPPTLSEMTHILETPDEELHHFGIKGMKWGVRRSDKELASVTNSEGETVGGISGGRDVKKKLKGMKAGQVAVLDTDDGPSIVVKQKDGTFKDVKVSADQEGVLRTMRKDPSEMSTREMKEAVGRAKALEEYNKLFNPTPNPNAEISAKVQSMQLQMQYSKLHSEMNPSRTKRAVNFINGLKPVYSHFQTLDKATNNAMSKNIKSMIDDLTGSSTKIKVEDVTKPKTPKPESAKAKAKRQKKQNDYVYDVTTLPRGVKLGRGE